MKNLFSIGQMSRLHNISVQTLRYYDKIRLFSPAWIDPDSGYRYYSSDQFILLEIIKYLKFFGKSLGEIRQIVNYHNSIDELAVVLKDQEKTVGEQIRSLIRLKEMIQEEILQLREVSEIHELYEIYQAHYEAQSAVFYDFVGSTMEECIVAIRGMLSNIERTYCYLPNSNFGFMSKLNEFVDTGCLTYRKLYFVPKEEMSSAVEAQTIVKIPEGDYLCILFKGSQEQAVKGYQMLTDYIFEKQLAVDGIFYESSLIHGFVTANEDDYIMEIKIMLNRS